MIVSQFTDLCYYFDSENVYHRSPAYLLSNLAHISMLGIDVFLLIRWKNHFSRRIRRAFWTYIIAPVAAMAVQAFFQDLQLIILATVASAVYMSMVIMQDQMEKYEKENEAATRMPSRRKCCQTSWKASMSSWPERSSLTTLPCYA
ncbi:MAG: hypothetical protein IJG94_11320 [Clostridia bacterium]|nr:hypothetical protein [Clostridia bacterium]